MKISIILLSLWFLSCQGNKPKKSLIINGKDVFIGKWITTTAIRDGKPDTIIIGKYEHDDSYHNRHHDYSISDLINGDKGSADADLEGSEVVIYHYGFGERLVFKYEENSDRLLFSSEHLKNDKVISTGSYPNREYIRIK